MTSIIEKRRSLHKDLENQRHHNKALTSQLSRLQAQANIGTSTCMIAHEINNLLTPLGNYATLALNNPDDSQLVEKALKKTIRNCQNAAKIMQSMISLTNGETQKKITIVLSELVDNIFKSLCRDFTKDRINVQIRIPEDLTVTVVPVQIQQVLMNLILNARDAMDRQGGTLTIEAEQNCDKVEIYVSDTGCGIQPEDFDKIFEPFFTTKTDSDPSLQNSGAGLGIAFCKQIIDTHAGMISAESIPDKGTTFKIILPKN